MDKHWNTPIKNIPNDYIDKHFPALGVAESLIPGVGGVGIVLGVGPAHITWSLGAKVAEFFGVAAAKAEDYIGSGRAGEHVKVVGEVLDKGVRVAAKNPDLVPEKYRKTVQTIAQLSEEEERANKAAELQQRIQEKENLQREYQTWKDEMDPAEKSYYELSGREPSMEDFVEKAKAGFEKDKKKQMEKTEEKAREKI
ncbi:hypothetical protein HY949_02185 [Candidatus Gottesmanbacteria bacterium]|nr:hypothetical protein [Candidatus Gottesmanbacteria bacterium]